MNKILAEAANNARGLAIDAIHKCSSGHLGLPLGSAEIGAVLYGNSLSHDPSDPNFFKTGLGSTINNYIGILGSYISHVTFMIFGETSYLLSAFLILMSLSKYQIFFSYSKITVSIFLYIYFSL